MSDRILVEDDIEIDFSTSLDAFVFDDMEKSSPGYHEVGQLCRVDFIVEEESRIYFIELKDPEHPRSTPRSRTKFQNKLGHSDFHQSFVAKYMETFMYRWCESKADKEIHFVILINIEGGLLPNLRDQIDRKLPFHSLRCTRWIRKMVASCNVLNLEQWNASSLGKKWPAKRISTAS
ncbi:MAG: hypothetical protein ACSHX6_01300 [Akkermansiaceae bacterium]